MIKRILFLTAISVPSISLASPLFQGTLPLTTALHLAVNSCNIEQVNHILQQKAYTLADRDMVMDTPLHTAYKSGCYAAMEPLMNAGFQPDAVDIEQRPVINVGLRTYVLSGGNHSVSLLATASIQAMMSNVTIDAFALPDMKKRTTLSTLCDLQRTINDLTLEEKRTARPRLAEVDVYHTLADCDVNQTPFDNNKPELQNIYDSAFREAKKSLGKNATRERIKEKAESIAYEASLDHLAETPDLVEHHDADGRTLLHVASGWGFTEVVDLLLRKGADIKARDFSGKTIAHNPARFGSKDMILHLHDVHGFDINQPDIYGFTPYQHAQYMLLTKMNKKNVSAYLEIKHVFQKCGVHVHESDTVQTLLHP